MLSGNFRINLAGQIVPDLQYQLSTHATIFTLPKYLRSDLENLFFQSESLCWAPAVHKYCLASSCKTVLITYASSQAVTEWILAKVLNKSIKEMKTSVWIPVGFGSSIKRIKALKQKRQNFKFPTLSSLLQSEVPIRIVQILDAIKCYLKLR